MLKKLKENICDANLELVRQGLVFQTWGNVSGRDMKSGLVVIKPSGVSYRKMKPADMVVIDPLGNLIEGSYKPSTDTPTHLYLYRHFNKIGGVVHTHSAFATAWAQAGRPIPPFGTTHADHFRGPVPCSRMLTGEEVRVDYEENTGKVIVEALDGIDPSLVPSVLVNSHGPFCWGTDALDAVNNAAALEEIARMAFYCVLLGRKEPVGQYLVDKHFDRKHGKDAYYGQGKKG
jgi:L-ribulose-5-phosphate 4-epimerase